MHSVAFLCILWLAVMFGARGDKCERRATREGGTDSNEQLALKAVATVLAPSMWRCGGALAPFPHQRLPSLLFHSLSD